MANLSELSISQLSKMLEQDQLGDAELLELKADSRQGARKLALSAIRKKEAEAQEEARLLEMTSFERRMALGGFGSKK